MKQQHLVILTATMLAASAGLLGQTPLVSVTAKTQVTTNADASVTAQTVERIPLRDGQTMDWRTTTSVTRPTKTGGTETTETVIERAPQQQLSQTIQRTTTSETTANGKAIRTSEITRNAFGKDTGLRVVEETAQQESDGSTVVRIVEQAADHRGQLALQREEQRRIRELNPAQTVIESQIRTYDNLRSRFDVTAVHNTEIRKQGDTTHTETTVRRTAGDQDRIVGRVLTTEMKTGDGTTRRETIEYGQGLYDKISHMTSGELKPKRKVVERVVSTLDGGQTLTREVFRLDVNGDWKPAPHDWIGDRP